MRAVIKAGLAASVVVAAAAGGAFAFATVGAVEDKPMPVVHGDEYIPKGAPICDSQEGMGQISWRFNKAQMKSLGCFFAEVDTPINMRQKYQIEGYAQVGALYPDKIVPVWVDVSYLKRHYDSPFDKK
jgi:hypothetical protein